MYSVTKFSEYNGMSFVWVKIFETLKQVEKAIGYKVDGYAKKTDDENTVVFTLYDDVHYHYYIKEFNSHIEDIRNEVESCYAKIAELKNKIKELIEDDCWCCGAEQYGHDSETRIECEKLTGTHKES